MDKITQKIQQYISDRLITWRVKHPNFQVVFSSSKEPGEGEHKLLHHINQSENKQFAVYGLDADLIFLSLASNKEQIWLLRESNQIKIAEIDKPFLWVEIPKVRKAILEWFSKSGLGAISSPKHIIRDFVVMCYLLGNDLPHISHWIFIKMGSRAH